MIRISFFLLSDVQQPESSVVESEGEGERERASDGVG